MSEPERQRGSSWSCLLHGVGRRRPLDHVLGRDELRRSGYPGESDLQRGYRRLDEAVDPGQPGRARTERAPRVFGLDCEMVLAGSGPAVARVSLVEWVESDHPGTGQVAGKPAGDGRPWRIRVVFDTLVKPEAAVIDHLTAVSGMSADTLAGAEASVDDVRDELGWHVRADDILCGHALENDLHALAVVHDRVLDTAVLYPHHEGPPARRSLDDLVDEYLSRRIQVQAHSSVEDASAALELAMTRIASGAGRLRWSPIPDDVCTRFTRLDLDTALDRLGFAPEHVRCAYLRGSRSVGVAGRRDDGTLSDWDLVLVTAIPGTTQDDIHLSFGNIDAAIHDVETFRRLIRQCSIWALECIFAPETSIWKEQLDFRQEFADLRQESSRELVFARLRRSVSYQSERQWRRARHDLERRGDRYACRKRMFIAIRFVMYGLAVARTGRIDDLGCANHLWNERLATDRKTTWAEFDRAYGPLYRERMREFRQLTAIAPRYGGFHQPPERLPPERRRAIAGDPVGPSCRADAPGAGLATVDHLRAGNADPAAALVALQRVFHIGVRHHARFPGVVQLRYTTRSRPIDHPVVRQCRGLILDAASDFAVLAYPFDRFFDSRDAASRSAELDWSSARVHDKLDGSLAILYWHRDRWNVASSRRPDARGAMCQRAPGGAIAFETLFWDIWRHNGLALPPPPGPGVGRRCFLFELTSWRHPIVVRYPGEALTLIGARDLDTLQELEPGPVAAEYDWPCAAWRSLSSVIRPDGGPGDESNGGPGGEPDIDLDGMDPAEIERRVRRAAATLDGSLVEGFVVCDARFHRVKIKSPDYVSKAWMFPLCPSRAAINPRRLLQLVISGAGPEFALYNPSYRDEIRELQRTYDRFCAEVEDLYRTLEPIEDQREFARQAGQRVYANLLFRMRKCGGTVQEHVAITGIRNVERYLRGRGAAP